METTHKSIGSVGSKDFGRATEIDLVLFVFLLLPTFIESAAFGPGNQRMPGREEGSSEDFAMYTTLIFE